MAISSAGYAGTVNDVQWAAMSRYFGRGYSVRNAAALACTQVGTTKTFSLAAGEFYGSGVTDTSDSAVTVAPTVPASGGQWSLIVARRVWATKLTTLVALAAATTTTSMPTAAPTAYPAMNTTPGVSDDQPLWWVWVNAGSTVTLMVDVRDIPIKGQEFVTASSVIQRDAKFIGILAAGQRVARLDRGGAVQRYNGASWSYELGGLVPIIPTSVLGAGVTLSPAGTGRVVLAGAGQFSINGAFSSEFEDYLIRIKFTAAGNVYYTYRLRANDVDAAGAEYDWARETVTVSTPPSAAVSGASGAAETSWGGIATSPFTNQRSRLDIYSPARSVGTGMAAEFFEANGAGLLGKASWSGWHRPPTAYDGLTFVPTTAALMSGTVQIYGYNES